MRRLRYRSIVMNWVTRINGWVSPPMCVFCFSVILYLLLGGYRALPSLFFHLSEIRMPSLSFSPKGAHMTILYYKSLLFNPEQQQQQQLGALGLPGATQVVMATDENKGKPLWDIPKKIEDFLLRSFVGKLNRSKEHSQKDIGYYGKLPNWLPDCKLFYLDLGVYDGRAMEVLYEPEKFPDSKLNFDIKEKFDILNGTSHHEFYSKHLCYIGFEPHKPVLPSIKKLVHKYSTRGYKSLVFPFAVTNENKNVILYAETTGKKKTWGPSLFKSNETGHKYKQFKVKGVMLSDFVKDVLKSKPIPIMKMDIEGSEYGVLLDLLGQGLLCQKYIQLILIQFHNAPMYDLGLGDEKFREIHRKIQKQWRCSPSDIEIFDGQNEIKKIETKKEEAIKEQKKIKMKGRIKPSGKKGKKG